MKTAVVITLLSLLIFYQVFNILILEKSFFNPTIKISSTHFCNGNDRDTINTKIILLVVRPAL